jgi:hypothetical protein
VDLGLGLVYHWSGLLFLGSRLSSVCLDCTEWSRRLVVLGFEIGCFSTQRRAVLHFQCAIKSVIVQSIP